MVIRVSALITTRNRPEMVDRLLDSITLSSENLENVIIVSSGTDIREYVNKYKDKLQIIHLHLSKGGQIRQKLAGIDLINDQIDLILVLDDDLLLDPRAIANIKDVKCGDTQGDIIGIGLSLPTTRNSPGRFFRTNLLKTFRLMDEPGRILRNGHATSYMNSAELIETQWLNGASAWKREVLLRYQSDFLDAKYSAYEDVIFSYGAGKTGRLVYAPKCKLYFQEEQPEDVSDYEAFHSASYWRFYFVRSNSELSVLGLLWSQIGRSLDFTYRTSGGLRERIKAFTSTVSIFFDLVLFTSLRTEPLKVLKLRLKRTD